MTLTDQDKLINDLIRENGEVTIKEYLDLVGEVKRIEKTNSEKIGLIMAIDKRENQIRQEQRRNCLKRSLQDRLGEDEDDLTDMQKQSRERNKKIA